MYVYRCMYIDVCKTLTPACPPLPASMDIARYNRYFTPYVNPPPKRGKGAVGGRGGLAEPEWEVNGGGGG